MKKTLIAVVLTLVLCLCAFGTTLAFLIDKTKPVVNTFTVGDVTITLTETKGEGTDLAKAFKMVPGSTIEKDPKIAVATGSEDCYLFVKIDESANLQDFIAYAVADGWTPLPDETGVYYREAKAGDNVSVLKDDAVSVRTTVTKEMMKGIVEDSTTAPTLTFTAYAVQKANIADATTAWNAIPNP